MILPTLCTQVAATEADIEQLRTNLDLLKEKREKAHMKLGAYQ